MLLSRMFGKNVPSGNLYLKFYLYILPLIISFAIAMVPIVGYSITLFLTNSNTLSTIILFVASASEFVMAILSLGKWKR
jgi:hypothetical protein